jgi:hypothetical protein
MEDFPIGCRRWEIGRHLPSFTGDGRRVGTREEERPERGAQDHDKDTTTAPDSTDKDEESKRIFKPCNPGPPCFRCSLHLCSRIAFPAFFQQFSTLTPWCVGLKAQVFTDFWFALQQLAPGEVRELS